MSSVATHPFSGEELMAFCDGELSAAESQAVKEHVAACAECAEQVNRFRQTTQLLSQWSAPPVPSRVDESVEEHLRGAAFSRNRRSASARRVPASKRRWRPWAIGGAVAAAALLLVAIGLSAVHYTELMRDRAEQKSYAVAEQREGPASGGVREQDVTASAYVESGGQRPGAVSGLMADNRLSAPAQGNAAPAAPALNAPLIARSVSFLIVAKDIPAARSSLDAILMRNHGYAAEINVYTPENDSPSLKASLRIPAANLPAALADLRRLGRVASESESGEDVTQQHADLDQRLKTARDTEERFRGVLQQRTGNVSDVLEVEEAISRVRGEIESMEADQKNLEHRVDFASIDLSVTEEYNAATGTGSAPLSVRVRNAFVAGYRNAVGTLVGIFLFLVEYGLAILIWVAILAVPLILLRRRYRRIHARM
ncbi:MAG: DUF4349 domain-containing protein [Terracidiphilus sp.]|jgi:anti-sigma factor RsiW